ncbi:MAG: penicillin-binding protein 2 [Solirubrobacterales bacterium]|nr:penicillin-binding protein 2 [Solirubrobacterales bacterium]
MALVERRIGLLFAVFLALLALAALRSLQLGTLKADGLASAAVSQQVTKVTVPARRGTIVDRKGVQLAVSQPADDVSATPYLVKDPAKAARQLAAVLEVDEAGLLKQLTRKDTGFVYLARRVPGAKADAVRKLGIAGVDLTPGQKREYPRDYLASQVLGAVGGEDKGLFGLEWSLEAELHGRDGERRIVRDGVGDDVQVRDITRSQPGARVQLTLDAAIQGKVEEVLKGIGETYQPKGSTAVVMDPRTGEVLAMANWPQINANDPAAAPGYANQNRAVGYTYEPGSTFKAFTVAGALEDGKVTPDTSFNLPPQIQVADRTITNSHPRGWATMTTAEILAESDNVGAITIGQRLGDARFDHWVRRFGFGSKTGVDLPGEERGIVLPLAKYSGSSMGNLPIGQGESVTPMQIASAYSAIANGGVLRTPRIIRRIGDEVPPLPTGKRIISEGTAAAVRGMLKGVLAPGGTAPEAHIEGYDLAGKTGTANKVDERTGEYSKANYVASFVGFAPAQHPRLLISIMVDEPKGAIYGGTVAAPAFQKIAGFALPYLGIEPK